MVVNMKRNKKPKIALIGAYPPPYGGVSIHIQRLKNKLEKKNVECFVYSFSENNYENIKNVKSITNPKKWILKYLFTSNEDIIHSHISDWRLRIIISLMSLIGKKSIISIHGENLKTSLKGNYFKKMLIKISLKLSSAVVPVNTDIKDLCLSIGVKPGKIEVISPFIPPSIKDNEIKEIPQKIWNFINNHSPIISANAYKITFFNNQDLYGLDLCVNLCADLKKDYPNIGFVFSLPDIGDYTYFNKIKSIIIEKNIEKNFIFITEPYQFYPILMKSDIFVRPTNTDGDSVSIREALYLGVPVIGSDVISRPEGTIIFRNRNIDDFIKICKEVISNYDFYKNMVKSMELKENDEKILKLYYKIYNE